MADTEVQGGFNHVVEKDMSQARLQAAQQYNAQVQQQRAKAPSSLKSGSPEEAQVKAEERQDAQQAFVGGGFNRQGSSKDSFASQREAALSSGKFDYSAVRSASYSPPPNFVNNKGARVSRPSEPVQSVPVPEKIVTKTEPPSLNPEPKLTQNTSKPLQISKEQLEKSDALRASQGLEPLEKVTNVQIVPSTKGPSKPEPTLSNDNTTTLYGKTFATFTPKDKDSGVASSFLKIPFVGTKSQTKEIPSTTIVDPLQFVIGGASGLIKSGGEALLDVLRAEAKPVAKESTKVGTADIGLNLNKPTEKQTIVKRETDLLNNFNRNVQASQGKQVTKVQQAKADRILSQVKTSKPMTSENVNLGTGIGKQVGKDGGTTLTDKFKPSPPTKPTPPNGKEVTVGKGGLTQLVKEKPQIQKPKPIQEQITQMKQEQVNLGSGLGKQVQKPKVETVPKTQAQIKTENYLQSLQKPKPIFKPKQDQSHDQVFENLNKNKPAIAKPQPQKQRRGTVPVLIPTKPPGRPTTRTVPTLIPITGQTTKQKQENVGITDLISTSVTRGKTPPPPPPKITTPPPPKMTEETPPPDKRKPPGFGALGINPASGMLGKVSKSGANKGYVGNVPLSSLVGIYNRSEVSYGGSRENLSRSSKTNYNKLGTKGKSPKLI